MSNCLAGCIADYLCGDIQVPGPAGGQAESFAPWVWISIGDGDEKITVGNKSFNPNPHTACIKSFEAGWIDNNQMVVEIMDEAGGRFGALLDSVQKCTNEVGVNVKVTFQFGWILATCQGPPRVIGSDIFEAVIVELETSYSEGKMKHKLKCGTINGSDEFMRINTTRGEDDKKITLEQAIENICALPPATRVRYCELQSGELKDVKFKWKNFPKGGPLGNWQADQQNRLSAITKWLAPYRIDDGTKWGKGIVIVREPKKPDQLILLQDPLPNPGDSESCGNNVSAQEGSFGTYIVNGGKCSSVIEFTPSFNWIRAVGSFSSGGGTSGPAKTNNNFIKNVKPENQQLDHGESAGMQQETTITQQAWDAYGPANAYDETMKSEMAHVKAGRVTSVGTGGVQADLRIIGDPRPQFCSVAACRNISIVAINPFHIQGASNNGCGDWLAVPQCNETLSNNMWMVVGINHAIKEGSYITTLKVTLAQPGIDAGKNSPLGGEGANGYTPQNNCK